LSDELLALRDFLNLEGLGIVEGTHSTPFAEYPPTCRRRSSHFRSLFILRRHGSASAAFAEWEFNAYRPPLLPTELCRVGRVPNGRQSDQGYASGGRSSGADREDINDAVNRSQSLSESDAHDAHNVGPSLDALLGLSSYALDLLDMDLSIMASPGSSLLSLGSG